MLFGTQACSLPSLSKDTNSLPKVDPQYSLMHLSSLFRWEALTLSWFACIQQVQYTLPIHERPLLFKRKLQDGRYTENHHLVLISFFQLRLSNFGACSKTHIMHRKTYLFLGVPLSGPLWSRFVGKNTFFLKTCPPANRTLREQKAVAHMSQASHHQKHHTLRRLGSWTAYPYPNSSVLLLLLVSLELHRQTL